MCTSTVFPDQSPLPRGGNATLTQVVSARGTYTIAVDDGAGPYELRLRVFRPQLESQRRRDHQILFLDFGGETFNTAVLGGPGVRNLSPLSTFLDGWGLAAEDEPAVIDAILATVVENFADVALVGANGDFFTDGVDGHFGIEILNRRDHIDPFGLPNVSRVIVGGSISELGIPVLGADATIFDLIGVGVGNIVAHEAGHFFGNFHTDLNNAIFNLMDRGGKLDNTVGGGRNRIFEVGAEDDVDVDFGIDMLTPTEGFTGSEDTPNNLTFGLATGMLIIGSTPVGGDIRFAPPTEFAIQFLDFYDPATVDAGDLTVNAATADGRISFTVKPSAAVELLGANELTLRLTYPVGDPVAGFYRFDLDEGQTASLVLTPPIAGNVWLELQHADGTVLETAADANVGRAIDNFVTPEAGTYFARVDGDSELKYSLLVVRAAVFDTEPNDGFSTAQDLAQLPAALGHAGGEMGDEDWYQFFAAAGDKLFLQTETPARGPSQPTNWLDPHIELYDPAWGRIAFGTPRADRRNERITLAAPIEGTYRVGLSAEGGTSGPYVLESCVSAAAGSANVDLTVSGMADKATKSLLVALL